MTNKSSVKTGKKMAMFWIWTIRNHDVIAANIRIYMFAAVAVVLLLCVSGAIHLKTALVSIFFGGVSIFALLWMLIENRRTQLNNISDPELRREAHEAMLKMIYPRQRMLEKRIPAERRSVRAWFWKKFMPELF